VLNILVAEIGLQAARIDVHGTMCKPKTAY